MEPQEVNNAELDDLHPSDPMCPFCQRKKKLIDLESSTSPAKPPRETNADVILPKYF